MSYTDVEKYLGATLAEHGFVRYAVEPDITWRDAPAWAVYYRSPDCKLQVCASDREGGDLVLLAALDAADVFGFASESVRSWSTPRMLDRVKDDIGRPPEYGSGEQAVWEWHRKVLEAHLAAACAALVDRGAP